MPLRDEGGGAGDEEDITSERLESVEDENRMISIFCCRSETTLKSCVEPFAERKHTQISTKTSTC